MEEGGMLDKIKKTTKKIFRRILLLLLVAGIAVLAVGYFGVYDEGVRAGIVLRLSKKGMIFKTYEGQLNLQTFGALKGASPIAESFDFSVDGSDQELIDKLEAVALSGERVNLHYVKKYWIFPWRGDTKYFITEVERLERQGN
ncbi:MAG: hypothetical protein RLN86_11505 [Cyclobacteriaceae bacterium]